VPVPVSQRDLNIMALLDQKYTDRPYYGVRRMWKYLQMDKKITVGRDHVRTLLRKMGIMALFPTRNLSKPNPSHRIYPYLLKGLEIVRPNQVWGVDITYVRLARGFAYLVAIIDWYSRRVLSWKLSNTLESGFCVEALDDALQRHGKPEIFNSDQGSQFTSEVFIDRLKAEETVRISMDGRGRAYDNIFTERLWWAVKYEDIFLHEYQDIPACRAGLERYFSFYNTERRHQSLEYQTPWEMFRAGIDWSVNDGRNGLMQTTLGRA
jgi:putative transposase